MFMKTSSFKSNREQGNTLMLTVVITALIGFVLAVYLTLVQHQNTANTRSQVWNSAMPIVEAGVEDALAHLNHHGATNLNCDGWTLSSGSYTMTRAVGDGFYRVNISNFLAATNSSPVIESFGYVVAPPLLAAAKSPYVLATVGGTINSSVPTYIGRGVHVQTRQDFIFTKGMVAQQSIDLNGNNIAANSFDSLDPLYSTNGIFDPTKTKDNGDIAVNSGLTNSLNVGNANIYGHLSTGPGGTIAIGPGGSVGSTSWHDGNNTGIESGWSKDDMNVAFPDVEEPFSGGAFTPTGGWVTNLTTSFTSNTTSSSSVSYPTVTGATITTNYQTSAIYPILSPGPIVTNRYPNGTVKSYTYPVFNYSTTTVTSNTTVTATYYDVKITQPGNYQLANLNGSVYVSANAILYVTTTLNMTALYIEAPNGKLALYSSAPSVSLTGNSCLNSSTAYSFSFWGLPTVTSIAFGGNAKFSGTIYAPNADFTLNGSGNETVDFIGASITKTVKMNGHFNFHYDESLRFMGPFRGFIVSTWLEMPPSSVPSARVASN